MLLKNIASMSGVNIAKAVVQFAVNMMIAYFVSPAEFGLVTFSLPFIAFIAMLTDLGLSSAIVRQPDLGPYQAGAAFSLMTVVGVAFAALLIAAGAPLEASLNMHGLAGVMCGLAISVVLSIVSITPRALLERRLQYQRIAIVEAAAVGGAAAVCVGAALLGAGVWALVVYYIVMQTVRSVAFTILSRGDFALNFHWARIVQMLSFGGWVLASNVLNFAARNGDNIIIGAWIGASAVGLYGLAYQFMIVPLMILSWPASGILMATLSRMHSAAREARGAVVLALIGVTAAFSFPAMIYLTFGISWPIQALMAPSWREVIPLIAALAPVGAVQSIAVYNGPVLLANGKARLQFLVGVANSIMLLATFFIAIPFGLKVLVFAYAVVAVPISCAMIYLICIESEIGMRSFFNALIAPLFASGAGMAAVSLLRTVISKDLFGWILETALYAAIVISTYLIYRNKLLAAIGVLTSSRAGDVEGAPDQPDVASVSKLVTP